MRKSPEGKMAGNISPIRRSYFSCHARVCESTQWASLNTHRHDAEQLACFDQTIEQSLQSWSISWKKSPKAEIMELIFIIISIHIQAATQQNAPDCNFYSCNFYSPNKIFKIFLETRFDYQERGRWIKKTKRKKLSRWLTAKSHVTAWKSNWPRSHAICCAVRSHPASQTKWRKTLQRYLICQSWLEPGRRKQTLWDNTWWHRVELLASVCSLASVLRQAEPSRAKPSRSGGRRWWWLISHTQVSLSPSSHRI